VKTFLPQLEHKITAVEGNHHCRTSLSYNIHSWKFIGDGWGVEPWTPGQLRPWCPNRVQGSSLYSGEGFMCRVLQKLFFCWV